MKISNLEAAVTITRALGHPARVRIVAVLHSGELCVCQVTEVLKLAQSTVSTHLRELKRAGLITERKDGRWVYFGLSDDADAAPWIEAAMRTLGEDPQLKEDELLGEELRLLPVEDLCRLGYDAAKVKSNSTLPVRS